MGPDAPVVAVVGADGFVGRLLVRATGGVPIVYGAPGPGDLPARDAGEVLRASSVVIAAGGFRVRPGLGEADYRESHAGAVRVLAEKLRAGQSLLLISSASVLGRDRTRVLGQGTPPRPETFPHAAYARAKLEAEEAARRAAVARGFRLLVLRPAVLYGGPGDGMVGTLAALARRGLRLRLVPAASRQHLCSSALLAEAVRRATAPGLRWPEEALALADPFVLTSADLDRAAVAAAGRARRRFVTVPFPPEAAGRLLRLLPRFSLPRLDLSTWGAILEILALDTVFDPAPAFAAFGLDPTTFSAARTWERVVRGEELGL